MPASSQFLGIISGQRRRTHADVADRASRIAGGLQQLGVGQGDSVCVLMRFKRRLRDPYWERAGRKI